MEPNSTSASNQRLAELLMACDVDHALQAVLVGMLREADRGR